ncbi:thymidine phosphorylase [Aestuariibius sp. 2305UL40-4]|uniref:thymidine phosphorylase n=1 Tax=Aestuariibius violaceus TaxID=3234132 RepID=UPI00345EC033
MDARTILARLRDGQPLSGDDLIGFAKGLADGSVSDAQAGAFAMAVRLNGLGEAGRVALTRGMTESGDVLKWDLPGPALDKHSTGGIGDCVSLILAPALAACGAYVPMISGRGLGHTGGTLDKLEAIPGVDTNVGEAAFRQMTKDTGCAIVSASARIAPADKRLYAIRDVTASVESIDLITASILSKKLAAGLDALVLDVKAGSGAFMTDLDDAKALAQALVTTANGAGLPTTALVTDMNAPLVPSMGNALEVAEVMQILTGTAKDTRIETLTAILSGHLLAQAKLAKTPEDGAERIRDAIASGAAADRFDQMIAALGGPKDFAKTWQNVLPEAPVILEVPAPASGHIAAFDGRALGEAVVHLGGGRLVESDRVDPAVGLTGILPLGAQITKGDPLARIHAADEAAAEEAARTVTAAITIGEAPPQPDLILAEIA